MNLQVKIKIQMKKVKKVVNNYMKKKKIIQMNLKLSLNHNLRKN